MTYTAKKLYKLPPEGRTVSMQNMLPIEKFELYTLGHEDLSVEKTSSVRAIYKKGQDVYTLAARKKR